MKRNLLAVFLVVVAAAILPRYVIIDFPPQEQLAIYKTILAELGRPSVVAPKLMEPALSVGEIPRLAWETCVPSVALYPLTEPGLDRAPAGLPLMKAEFTDWSDFVHRYPDTDMVDFSRVVGYQAGRRATVFVSTYRGSLSGEGTLYVLKLGSKGWRVTGTTVLYVS